MLGLGNPGPQYDGTAHNVGFRCIDAARRILCLEERRAKDFLESDYFGNGMRIKLVKPLTFMNLSGSIFAQLSHINIEKLVVFCDNIDLQCGKIRFRYKGSSAGHNGLKSIISLGPLGNDFYRMYIGVGREEENGVVLNAADSVLRRMSREKSEIIGKQCDKAARIALDFLKDGDFDAARSKCGE